MNNQNKEKNQNFPSNQFETEILNFHPPKSISKYHLLSAYQFKPTFLKNHIKLSLKLKNKGYMDYKSYLESKRFSLFFLSSSTRTKYSFKYAIENLGGSFEHFDHINSSISKGETIKDAIIMLFTYGFDGIIYRDPNGLRMYEFLDNFKEKIFINGGNGSIEHPTQSLLDLVTIYERFKKIDNLNITLIGDLLHHRSAHSLVISLMNFKKIKLTLLAPEKLQLPAPLLQRCSPSLDITIKNNPNNTEIHEALNNSHVWYICPFLPKLEENYIFSFQIHQSYSNLMKNYKITRDILEEHANPDLVVLHPLPRHFLLDESIDNSNFNGYFEQAKNGIFSRSSLLIQLFNNEFESDTDE